MRFVPLSASYASRNTPRSPAIFSWLPRVVMTGDGHVYTLWQEIVFSGGTHGGEIFFARSTDGGANFAEPQNLFNTTNGAGKGRLTRRYWHNGSLDLAAGPGHGLYAAWTEYQGPLRVSRSTDAGQTWSEPVLVAGGEAELPARGPTLAVGPGGRIHLAWTLGEDPAADIHYASSDDSAETFTDPTNPSSRKVSRKESLWPVSTRRHDLSEAIRDPASFAHAHADAETFTDAPKPSSRKPARAIRDPASSARAHADAPKLAVHTDGTVHLAWMESPKGPLKQYRIRYTRRDPGAEDFQEPRTISTPLPENFDSAGFPHLALDADGDPYVLFDLFTSRSNRGTGLGMTWSDHEGESFANPVAIPRGGEKVEGINGSLQGLLMDKLAVTPDGDIIAINSTFDHVHASFVWLMRTR